jgi:hypothetical protein
MLDVRLLTKKVGHPAARAATMSLAQSYADTGTIRWRVAPERPSKRGKTTGHANRRRGLSFLFVCARDAY